VAQSKAGVVLLSFRTSGTTAAAKKARKVGEELEASGSKAKAGAAKMSSFTGALDDALGSLLPFDTHLGDVAKGLDKFDSGLSGGEGKLKKWGTGLGIAAAGVGLAVGTALTDGIVKSLELGGATKTVTAQLGLTEAESARVGSVAGSLYSSAYGESITEVTNVVGDVVSSIDGMGDASEEVLGEMSQHALNFSKVFEQDTGRVTQVVGQMLKTGLASDAEEAFDLLTASMQAVPKNVREDVMDAADEYGPFFSQLGLGGEEAFGLLAKGAEQGMYGIDKTGDALKELTIRSTDMSKSSVEAYDAIGLSAEDMTAGILAGGEDARGAFDDIIGGLLSMEDPAAQSQAALALFGTPLEDLGTDKIPGFLESLKGGTDALGDFKGAADEMDETINSGPLQGWKELGRTWQGITMELGERLLPVLQPITDWLSENPQLAMTLAIGLGILGVALGIATAAVWAFNIGLFASPITWIVLGIAALVAGIVALAMNWDSVVAWVSEVWQGFTTWLGESFTFLGEKWTAFWDWFAQGFSSVWEWIKEIGGAAWSWIDQHIFAPFRHGIELIVRGFEVGSEAIGAAWEGIKKAAAVPINFVLGTIWNDGLRSFWNDVVGAIGLDSLKLPKAPLVEFAEGGVMPGYTPGRDVHEFYSPTAGRLALSGGEAIMRPEFTRAVGGPAGVDRLNAAARGGSLDAARFADGGVWGWASGVWSTVTEVAGNVWEGVKDAAAVAGKFITDPAGAVQEYVVDGLLRPLIGTDGNIFQRFFGELPIQLVENMVDLFSGGSESASVGKPGMGWEAMWAQVHGAFPGMVKTSDYRPGATTVNGGQSYHALGRAIDLIPATMDTFNKIAAMFPNASELIYTPAGNRQLLNGQPFAGWSPAVKAQHYNHVHLAMADGGVFPMLATGGPVKAGEGYIVGDGGVPELFVPGADGYVYPEVPQMAALSSADIASSLDDVEVSVGQGAGDRTIVRVVTVDGRVLAETVFDESADEEARL